MTELTITQAAAELLCQAVEREAELAKEAFRVLDSRFARLGALLAKCKQTEAWRHRGHSSFTTYLSSLRDKYGRSKEQLYAYTGAAEHLLPAISESDLDRIGISKGFELARASKTAGRPVTPELVALALDPEITAKELRAEAFKTFELGSDTRPAGTWLDVGGFYVTPDEKKTLTDAMELTERLLGLSQETSEWAKRKETILAWAQEFAGTHAQEVYGEQETEPGVG
jgi:NOL1/NOP2/fmu family ribosome biogenesis protein